MDQIISHSCDMKSIILLLSLSRCFFLLLSLDFLLLFSFLVPSIYSNSRCHDNNQKQQHSSKRHHPTAANNLSASSCSGNPPSPFLFSESFFLHLPPSSLAASAAFAHNFLLS